MVNRFTILGADGSPYMTRFRLGRLYIHVFHRSDTDPDCHDHPWDFWTFPLTSYVEEVVIENRCNVCGHLEGACGQCGEMMQPAYILRRQIVRAWQWHFRPSTHCHRVLGRYSGPRTKLSHDLYAEGRAMFPGNLYDDRKIVTIVWKSPKKRDWGFMKNRDGKWCWVPWRDYVFGSGKEGPPITAELQQVFGQFGKVVGIVADGTDIKVTYEGHMEVTFLPITQPKEN